MARQPPLRTVPIRRPAGERVLAWLYTGPLGHLWSAVATISLLWLQWFAGRVRERVGR